MVGLVAVDPSISVMQKGNLKWYYMRVCWKGVVMSKEESRQMMQLNYKKNGLNITASQNVLETNDDR